MKQEINTENNNTIFIYALIGALLFTAAFGFTIANFSGIASLSLTAMMVPCLLIVSSGSLLYKAIKRDRNRLNNA
jgi:hypothetical protein